MAEIAKNSLIEGGTDGGVVPLGSDHFPGKMAGRRMAAHAGLGLLSLGIRLYLGQEELGELLEDRVLQGQTVHASLPLGIYLGVAGSAGGGRDELGRLELPWQAGQSGQV